ARAVDAYLAPGYNPPAESMALDALRRAVTNVEDVVFRDKLCARREMMASGLNSSLALQKGLCAVHAISNAVASVAARPIDPSTLGGLLIPHLARTYGIHGSDRMAAVRQSLAIPDGEGLGTGLSRILAALPVARSLDELGVAPDDLPRAARLALGDRAIGNSPMHLDFDAVLGVLHSVQGDFTARDTAAE
ncbi:MAG: iron-containing alcohol dehydrogenase, partial [Pseudomonadota bacterium]